jgi:hypothetical protein
MAKRKTRKRPSAAIEIDNYAELNQWASAFARGKLNTVILCGTAGAGKSAAFEREFKNARARYLFVGGSLAPMSFYKLCFEYRDKPVFIDDVPSIYKKATLVELMKHLTNTKKPARVTWTSSTSHLGDIPREFLTASPVCIVANQWESANENVVALEDRAHVLIFEPTASQVHAEIIRGNWFAPLPGGVEILKWFADRLPQIIRPSMRHYTRAQELLVAGFDWQAMMLESFTAELQDNAKFEKLKFAAHLIADRSKRAKQKIAEFAAAGHGSKATLYRIWQRFKADKPLFRFCLSHSC